ncbi:ATP-binding cassette domain-containing protein [Streptomyces phaeochromogenes]
MENLKIAARRPGDWPITDVYERFLRLAERKGNRWDQLSGGEQEMLSIERALLTNPRLLLMDEPSDGLAPTISIQSETPSPRRRPRAWPCCSWSRTCRQPCV